MSGVGITAFMCRKRVCVYIYLKLLWVNGDVAFIQTFNLLTFGFLVYKSNKQTGLFLFMFLQE